jgi:hypothetical protein
MPKKLIDLFSNQGAIHPHAISFPLFHQLMVIGCHQRCCKIASHDL